MEDQNLLDDFSQFQPVDENFEFQKVDKGVRLGNYIIDRIVFMVLGVAALIAVGNPEVVSNNRLVDMLFSSFIAFLYYAIIEATTGGRSIGKFITGTRAVYTDGSPIDVGAAFARALYRIIPFDALSFVGDSPGWHDSWSATMVVKESEFKRFNGI